jgi:hypothetical protein
MFPLKGEKRKIQMKAAPWKGERNREKQDCAITEVTGSEEIAQGYQKARV